jgi:hypothetical protein
MRGYDPLTDLAVATLSHALTRATTRSRERATLHLARHDGTLYALDATPLLDTPADLVGVARALITKHTIITLALLTRADPLLHVTLQTPLDSNHHTFFLHQNGSTTPHHRVHPPHPLPHLFARELGADITLAEALDA